MIICFIMAYRIVVRLIACFGFNNHKSSIVISPPSERERERERQTDRERDREI